MSDNLKVAKECGAASIGCYVAAFHTPEELDTYTSRILASQQAAHDAEIAELRKEIAYAERCALAQTRHAEAALEKLSAANAACAMKDEALQSSNKLLAMRMLSAADMECQRKENSKVISASPESVAAWEAEKLLPLKRQVAMLRKFIEDHAEADNSGGEYPSSCVSCDATYGNHASDCELVSVLNNTQATADQFIAECEQRGAVKALEDATSRIEQKLIKAGTFSSGKHTTSTVLLLLGEVEADMFRDNAGATSKKAG